MHLCMFIIFFAACLNAQEIADMHRTCLAILSHDLHSVHLTQSGYVLPDQERYPQGMWGTEGHGYFHDNANKSFYTSIYQPVEKLPFAKITWDAVMNNYWILTAAGSDDEKKKALKAVQQMYFDCNSIAYYRIWRHNMAAAAYANCTLAEAKNTKIYPIVRPAVHRNDITLLRHMLYRGANIHEIDFAEHTPIYYAHTVPTAQLLIEYGALAASPYVKWLLHSVAQDCTCSADLIPLYIQYENVDLFARNYDQRNVLGTLVELPAESYVLEKINALLDNISSGELLGLLEMRDKNGSTVMQQIQGKINGIHTDNRDYYRNLQVLILEKENQALKKVANKKKEA